MGPKQQQKWNLKDKWELTKSKECNFQPAQFDPCILLVLCIDIGFITEPRENDLPRLVH